MHQSWAIKQRGSHSLPAAWIPWSKLPFTATVPCLHAADRKLPTQKFVPPCSTWCSSPNKSAAARSAGLPTGYKNARSYERAFYFDPVISSLPHTGVRQSGTSPVARVAAATGWRGNGNRPSRGTYCAGYPGPAPPRENRPCSTGRLGDSPDPARPPDQYLWVKQSFAEQYQRRR